MWSDLFRNVDYIKLGIDVSSVRDQTIRNNIANVDTPNYKASEVEFETYLARAVAAEAQRLKPELKMVLTNEMHIQHEEQPLDIYDIQPAVLEEETSIRYDENNVDIEVEMAALAKNSIQYNLLVQKLNSEFNRLRTAISGNVG